MTPALILGAGALLAFAVLQSGAKEVETPTSSTADVDNDWHHIEQTFGDVLSNVFQELEALGWSPVLYEGWRSDERQAALYAEGASSITWSSHQWVRDGEKAALGADVIDANDGWGNDDFFAALEQVAVSHGLESGNAWYARDGAHVQAIPSSIVDDVRDGEDPGPWLAELT